MHPLKYSHSLVIGIQDSSDGLCIFSFAHRSIIISGVERLEVEASLWLSPPETDVVGVDRVVARDGDIVRHCEYLYAAGPAIVAGCVTICATVQLDGDGVVETS